MQRHTFEPSRVFRILAPRSQTFGKNGTVAGLAIHDINNGDPQFLRPSRKREPTECAGRYNSPRFDGAAFTIAPEESGYRNVHVNTTPRSPAAGPVLIAGY